MLKLWAGSVCKYGSSVIHLIHLLFSTHRGKATVGDGVFPAHIFQSSVVRVTSLQFVHNMD